MYVISVSLRTCGGRGSCGRSRTQQDLSLSARSVARRSSVVSQWRRLKQWHHGEAEEQRWCDRAFGLDSHAICCLPQSAALCTLLHALYRLERRAVSSNLVEEPNDLARHVLPPRLLVIHDPGGGGEDDVAELTRRQELDDPLLHVAQLDVVARADNASLVEAGRTVSIKHIEVESLQDSPAVQLDHDFAVAVVIDLLELANVACSRQSQPMSRKIKRASSASIIGRRVRSSPLSQSPEHLKGVGRGEL